MPEKGIFKTTTWIKLLQIDEKFVIFARWRHKFPNCSYSPKCINTLQRETLLHGRLTIDQKMRFPSVVFSCCHFNSLFLCAVGRLNRCRVLLSILPCLKASSQRLHFHLEEKKNIHKRIAVTQQRQIHQLTESSFTGRKDVRDDCNTKSGSQMTQICCIYSLCSSQDGVWASSDVTPAEKKDPVWGSEQDSPL